MKRESDRPDAGTEDARCVQQVLTGDASAFDPLVKRYQRRAMAVSYRLLNDRDDAMEVTQDAFLKAFDKLESLAKPERFGSWLLRIVSNLSLNKRRRRALRRTASLDVAGDEDDTSRGEQQTDIREDRPDEITSGNEARDILGRELAKLPEKQRRALVLFSMEKLPQKEVAKMLGISVEAVKWHVFTARKKLKERLREYL
jgi:RNA polymerase sigma-70 factor (ECF subfamily)